MTRDPDAREHFVYRAYDDADRLLYIGCSLDLSRRWSEHKHFSWWADLAVRFAAQGPFTREVARRKESEAILAERPFFNDSLDERRRRLAKHKFFRDHLERFLADGLDVTAAAHRTAALTDAQFPNLRERYDAQKQASA